jgi:hypothetical protein
MIRQDLLNQLPDRLTRLPKPVDSKEFVKQSEMAQILMAIHEEMRRLHLAVKDHSATNALGSSLADIELAIGRLSTEGVEDKLDGLKEALASLPAPQVNVDTPVVNVPELDLSALLEAIRAIKLDFNGDVKVTNQDEVVKALNDLKPLLAKVVSAVEEKEGVEEVKVTNLGDLKVDSFPKEALKLLGNLDTDAKNPIAVRLSDGKKFYDAISKVVETGRTAVAMGTTPSFTNSTGTPTRPLVDSNSILKTTPDAYTVKIEYSGDNPIYVAKASPGSATSAAVWQISKLTYSGSNVTDVQWAGGANTFTNIWDSRAGYSYS